MNCSRLLVTTIIGGSLFFGPPAAEMNSERKEKHGMNMPVRDFNEHPLDESRPSHVRIVNISMSSTASNMRTLRFPQEGWAIAS